MELMKISRKNLENKYVDLINISKICLHNNNIELLDSQIFNGLINLQTIDLSHNKIPDFINRELFAGLRNLTEIYISNNQLESINEHTFEGLINLEIIDVSKNKITKIQRIFENLNKIKKIDLSNNQIEYIDENAFKGLHTLHEINLHGNYHRRKTHNLYLEDSVHFVSVGKSKINDINFIFNLRVIIIF